MAKIIICPHCGEKIYTNSLSKASENKNSTSFFDDSEQKEIEKLLKKKNIDLGKAVKNEY